MMLRHCLILSLALCAVLSGCAARESAAPTALVPEEAPALSFDERVAALPEGSAQYFAESPFGPAAIDAGPFYLSGLGDECRSVRVARGSTSHRFALCKEKNGVWHFIPTIFESMPQ